jgi:predicted phage terminase large subunit-like protein
VKKAADHTAGALVGVGVDSGLVLGDVERWKAEWPDSREKILDLVARDRERLDEIARLHRLEKPPHYLVGVEAQGMQLALVQDLQRNNLFLKVPLYAIRAHGDKKERASVWAARAKAGLVEYVPGPWWSGFLARTLAFDGKGSVPDDEQDAVSGAVELLYKHRGGLIEPKKTYRRDSWDYYAALGKQVQGERV